MKEHSRSKIRMGELLVRDKLISQQQLEGAMAEQGKTGEKLGQCLVRLGYIEENDFLNFLSKQLKIPFIDLKEHYFSPDIVRQLPESFAR